ncbi:MAG: ATP-grasp domain-containing protein, partial [Bacteroidota bacterium]
MNRGIFPPATIGIIGGGQLGMMTIREAQRMGYRSIVWDPDPECPASRLADDCITAPYADSEAARRFADRSAIVTYEFENIESGAVEVIEESKQVLPGSAILKITQHRELEKAELTRRGIPVCRYAVARSAGELKEAVASLGFPVVVKTTTSGYDGKGQTVIRSESEL